MVSVGARYSLANPFLDATETHSVEGVWGHIDKLRRAYDINSDGHAIERSKGERLRMLVDAVIAYFTSASPIRSKRHRVLLVWGRDDGCILRYQIDLDIVIRYLVSSCVDADSFTEFVVRVALHQENLTHAPVHDSSD